MGSKDYSKDLEFIGIPLWIIAACAAALFVTTSINNCARSTVPVHIENIENMPHCN